MASLLPEDSNAADTSSELAAVVAGAAVKQMAVDRGAPDVGWETFVDDEGAARELLLRWAHDHAGEGRKRCVRGHKEESSVLLGAGAGTERFDECVSEECVTDVVTDRPGRDDGSRLTDSKIDIR